MQPPQEAANRVVALLAGSSSTGSAAADPDTDRQIVPIIHQARDLDAEAADHIEHALRA